MFGLKAQEDAFTVLPTNTKGVIGENVTLNCALTDGGNSLFWLNPDETYVFEKGTGILSPFEGQYGVQESGTNYNLVILNAAVDDAGQYACQCATKNTFAYAEVILLGMCFVLFNVVLVTI